jgi:hypothetical protein
MRSILDRLGLVGKDRNLAVRAYLDTDGLSTGRERALERLGNVALVEGLAGTAAHRRSRRRAGPCRVWIKVRNPTSVAVQRERSENWNR